jgi:hypothetical protein
MKEHRFNAKPLNLPWTPAVNSKTLRENRPNPDEGALENALWWFNALEYAP